MTCTTCRGSGVRFITYKPVAPAVGRPTFIRRCVACARFSTDDAAAAHVRKLVDKTTREKEKNGRR